MEITRVVEIAEPCRIHEVPVLDGHALNWGKPYGRGETLQMDMPLLQGLLAKLENIQGIKAETVTRINPRRRGEADFLQLKLRLEGRPTRAFGVPGWLWPNKKVLAVLQQEFPEVPWDKVEHRFQLPPEEELLQLLITKLESSRPRREMWDEIARATLEAKSA